MKVALVDNGSVEAAAHEGLRAAALAIGARAGAAVEAVSWRHSDRIPGASLRDGPAWTLAPWVRAQVAAGEREFLLVPFFISAQGAIGTSLRRDLDALGAAAGGFSYAVTEGLSQAGVLPRILAERVRARAASRGLRRPSVVVVDHGGPSRASAEIRDQVADAVRAELGPEIGALRAASMESPAGPGFEFNRPLLEEALALPGFDSGDVVIAPLFLLPGRHAGTGGDLDTIARVAEARAAALRCHVADLVGTHPLAVEALAAGLLRALGAALHP